MSKKIDERLPQHIGQGMLPAYPAVKSPWEKQIGYRDALHYIARYNSVVSAACMQALRILVPNYEERAQFLSEEAYGRLYEITKGPYGGKTFIDGHNMHPFCRGNFVGALIGDKGDEAQLMCGRCNDFGSYRAEKELDVCDWDIVGTELCRATTQSLQANADAIAEFFQPGPKLEFSMYEAKGCGDRHCRIVAESREKYPLPKRKQWESFGPIATADQIKYTPEEDCVEESMVFREECNYTFSNGTNAENDATHILVNYSSAALTYIMPCIDYLLQKGEIEEEFTDHVIWCVCEAAGKSAFGEQYYKDAVRNWLGVPRKIGDDDGRVMGGHIEVYLQSMLVPYEVEAFNKDEVIYQIDRARLTCGYPKFVEALKAYWHGAVKTLINAQWFLWEEDSPQDKIRIKIAKKIDKFC